jgi:hypothetical protein
LNSAACDSDLSKIAGDSTRNMNDKYNNSGSNVFGTRITHPPLETYHNHSPFNSGKMIKLSC